MNRTSRFTRVTLAAAIAAVLMSGTVMAQDTATQTPAKKQAQAGSSASNPQSLNQVVITGNAAALGLRKIDASYSITTASYAEIKEKNPVSTADLLKMSPGVFPESSGGQTGANIEVAGFPGGGDAPFVTVQMNGSPIYPASTLSFLANSSMFRLDDTIDRVETVQGGPAVLYGNGQPGLTANFILKQGTDVPSGDIGLTVGSEGMQRLDGFYGFPLGHNWYGSIGGFWRKSDGVRDPQFSADKGGQLTATLAHDLDNGSVMFYARALHDKNQFVTDTPILNPSKGQFDNYPGFSPLTGTFGSNADRYETIATTPCATAGCTPGGVGVDLADGRGADIHMIGGNLDLDFGSGWSLNDKFNFTGGNMDTRSFFSTGQNPTSLADFIAGKEAADGLPTDLTASATYTNGKPADMNENVTTQGLWYVNKNIRSFSNEVHLSKELFDGNTLTFGNYTAVYSAKDTWFLGNNMLLQAKNNPNPIVVNLSDGATTYALTDPQGFTSGSSFALHEDWNATNTAFFVTDSWKLDNWLFDAGVRVEHQSANGTLTNNASGDLDNNPNTLYNNNASYLTGDTTKLNYSKSAPSWTIGANYTFNDHSSAYARVNDGIHFPAFDDLRGLPTTPVQKIHNMEVGYKYQNKYLYVDVAAYRRLFYGVPYTITTDNGQQSFTYGSATKGVNFQATIRPTDNFSIALTGDYMDGHYTNYKGCVSYQTQSGGTACDSITGMQLQRQPKFQYRITPAYHIPAAWGDIKFWATYEHVGDRYGDLIEQQPLGNYYDVSAGILANVGTHWTYTLRGTNLTNQIGITEGNSRLFGFASGGGVILARSIEGREVNFQVKYEF
ncbi:TonB-dependent receptor [Oleiagrimonas sp. C23AA]|uniref:TonB-dependent receptor n=1 Tax=Oleiagrimonas sp. C23AA TaxID=2719047 RepID=UPI0014225B3E|nr:TonB-dependent receptor [Oleiagrimonas sp. C23AA]NII11900.1 TonB-dependent receptor [Oleiagrimonas sp. C23AA]